MGEAKDEKEPLISRVIIYLLVFLLAAGFIVGIALAIYYGIQDSEDEMEDTVVVPVSTVSVSGRITMEETIPEDAVHDTMSEEFTKLEDQFCEDMTSILSEDNLDLVSCEVDSFTRAGVVSFKLIVENDKGSQDASVVKALKRYVVNSLNEATSEGTDTQGFKRYSLEIDDDENDCEINDCKYNCVDEAFTFSCSCQEGFDLADDGKSCNGRILKMAGIIGLNESYDDDLEDPESDAYSTKTAEICAEIGKVFDSPRFEDTLEDCTVNNFMSGSLYANLSLTFEVPTISNVSAFLGDAEETLEVAIANETIFSGGGVIYYDFDTDFKWCHDDPLACRESGCDGIKCICDEGLIYHGPPADCRDTQGFGIIPPYEVLDTLYFSTKPAPDAPNNTVYHVIVCIAYTSLLDQQGLYPATVFLDPKGNEIPFYLEAEDKNGKPINDRYYKNLYLNKGVWVLDHFFNNYVRAVAFSEPTASDSGTYTCHVDGYPSVATYIDIEFVDCEDEPYVFCGGHRECVLKEKVCDGVIDCLNIDFSPETRDETFCNCTGDVFHCDDGLWCVPNEDICDPYGTYDCNDGSDQKNCVCSEDTFACASGDRCIPMDWLCDGVAECPDADDETDEICGDVCNTATEHKCANSTRCISKRKMCDGHTNCPLSDDETGCEITCQDDEVPCPDLDYVCISPMHLCDGVPDCPNGGDESVTECDGKCKGFTCTNGTCLANYTVCNGYCECDGDCLDEKVCNCTDKFLCDDGQCLMDATLESAFCNGVQECMDGSDEPENCTCLSTQFDCEGTCIPMTAVCDGIGHCSLDERECNCTAETFICDNGLCLNPSVVCDQESNCGDFSDEINCPYCKSLEGYHYCDGDGICILDRAVCDGIEHCPNGTDELNCPECLGGTFKCIRNGEDDCVPNDWKCDGAMDCDNGEDEENCDSADCQEFHCNDHSKCLSNSQQCDGYQDCSDGSDEWNCYRVDEENDIIKFFDGASQTLIPVCGNKWDFNNNQKICDLLGKGLTTGHQVKINTGGDDKYLIFGDTLQIGSLSDCGSETGIYVMCEEIVCGMRSDDLPSGFIFNGDVAAPGAWPWHTVLYKGGDFNCGATLVYSQWVVTAAHCVYPRSEHDAFSIRLGSNIREGYDVNAIEMPVSQIIVHPKYNDDTLANDIALLKLPQKVTYTDYIRPACLPEQREKPDSTANCYLSGFGTINKVNPKLENQISSNILLEAKMTIHSNDQCREDHFPFVIEPMICAGYVQGPITGCQGDSGGPLVCQDEYNRWSLWGAASWAAVDDVTGISCTSYTGFADVSRYKTWLKQQMSSKDPEQ